MSLQGGELKARPPISFFDLSREEKRQSAFELKYGNEVFVSVEPGSN
jgi:hypothetical protein